jgi:hypothetical protein
MEVSKSQRTNTAHTTGYISACLLLVQHVLTHLTWSSSGMLFQKHVKCHSWQGIAYQYHLMSLRQLFAVNILFYFLFVLLTSKKMVG